jgi:hypothetical protein
MLKIMADKWRKNKNKLEKELKSRNMVYNYKDLVKITFDCIFNDEGNDYGKDLDIENITEIDDGEYQGTLLYLIPFNKYQPSEYDYLMTYVNYGSCSVCDTLLSITGYMRDLPDKGQLKELMQLCLNIIQNTIKPYNNGWRGNALFEELEEQKND